MQFKKISLRSTELRSGEVQKQVLGLLKLAKIYDKEIEQLQNKIAQKLGYKLVDHKLELYGVKKNKWAKKSLLKLLVVKWMNMTAIE